MTEKKVILGSKVEDTISGFKGIAIARAEWLHGCARIAVQPKTKKEAETIPDAQWVDEPQLKVTKSKRKTPAKKKTKKPGGPHSPVSKRRVDDHR